MPDTKTNTATYALKKRNKIIYVGTTNDPKRREQEHKNDGKNFSHMKITSHKMTMEEASIKEQESLNTYRKNHGQNPRYNKSSDEMYSTPFMSRNKSIKSRKYSEESNRTVHSSIKTGTVSKSTIKKAIKAVFKGSRGRK